MTGTFRVFVADRIAADGLAPLRGDARFDLIERPGLTGDELARAVADADAVIVRSATRITRELIACADRLRVIGRAGVGVDTIDVDAATERGIAVLNAPAGNTVSAAELTMALLLAVVRRLPAADRSMKAGEWDRSSFNGVELQGKTLGLVGAGRVGGEVARRARAFGMRVVAYDPHLSEEGARRLELPLAPLDEVLRDADVISLHVPLTEATEGLLGEAELRAMRRGAFVINAARGGVVDEAALERALADGHLGGAALDVFADEPLPAVHPLRALPNVVLTPHLGASTAEAQSNVAVEIAEAVRAALVDGDFSRAVNAPAISGERMRGLRPVLGLAERLGRLAAALQHGPVESVEVRYAGGADDALRPLSAAALIGILSDVVGRSGVNFVNALHLAQTRGMRLERIRQDPVGPYAEYVELRLTAGAATVRVAGALLAEEYPRLIRIGDFRVDIAPRGPLLVLRNRDVPGVIGRVGSLLGNAGINIAEYHQARREAGGEALAAVSLDAPLAAAHIAALRELPEVIDACQVQLD